MSDVEIKIDDKIAPSIAQKLASIKTNAAAADTEVDRLKSTLASISSSRAFQKDASEAEKLKNTLRQASQVTVSYYGQVSKLNTALDHQGRAFANNTRQVAANTNAIKANNASLATTTGSLSRLIGLLGTYAGGAAFLDVANAAQLLNNQLRTITNSQGEFNRLQEQLFDLSNRTRTSIDQTTQLYVNFYKVLQSVGIQQDELFRMVETLNKGFQVGGRTAMEAAGATRQLIQALQSGVLRGEEFNSIMEQMPVEILNSLAKAAGVGVEELRKMAEAGLLTRDVIRKGLSGAAEEIDRLFARTVPTINNAFTILRNNAIKFFTENTAGANALSKAILFMSENLHIIIPLIAAFGVAWLAVQFVSVIGSLWAIATAIGAVTVAAAPLIATVVTVVGLMYALAASIALVTGNWDNFHGWINQTIDDVGRLAGELAGAAGQALGLSKLTQEQTDFGTATANSVKSAAELRSQVQGLAGGVSTQSLTAAANASTTALNGTSAAAANLTQQVKLGAGEIATLSGKRSGVYDVKKALEETSGAMTSLSLNGKHAVEQLTSLSGKATGIYKITDAVKSNNNALVQAANSAKNYAAQLTYAVRAASRLASSYIPGVGSKFSSPSFQDVGISNTGSNSSFAGSYASGGSFMVGGRSGVDKNPVSFNATRGEKVTIQTRRQQRMWNRNAGGGQYVDARSFSLNIQTSDADSFARSKRQVASAFGDIINQ